MVTSVIGKMPQTTRCGAGRRRGGVKTRPKSGSLLKSVTKRWPKQARLG